MGQCGSNRSVAATEVDERGTRRPQLRPQQYPSAWVDAIG